MVPGLQDWLECRHTDANHKGGSLFETSVITYESLVRPQVEIRSPVQA